MRPEIRERWISKGLVILHYSSWVESEARDGGILHPALHDNELLARITRKLELETFLSQSQIASYGQELLRRHRARHPQEVRTQDLTDPVAKDMSVVQGKSVVQDGYLVWKKCGKNCHCNGGHGHGPYRYASVRQGVRVKTKYLGKGPGDTSSYRPS